MRLPPYAIEKFSGQNDRFSPIKIRTDQAEKAQNVFSDEVGGVSIQEKAMVVSSLPSGVAGAGSWSYKTPSGADFFIGANVDATPSQSAFFTSQDAKVWTNVSYVSDDTGTITDILYTAPHVPEGVTFKGLFWLTTGENDYPLLTFDGTDWIPAGSAKILAGAAGLLSGAYKWLVTYIVDGEEILGAPSLTFTLTLKHGLLSKIPIGPPTVTTDRKVYRTKAGGSVFFFVASIGTTVTTYDDNTADGSLITALSATNPGIPTAHFPVVHQQRLHLIKTTDDPAADFYSTPDFPFLYPVNNAQDIPVEDEVLWGGFSFKETLVLPSEKNIWVLSGSNIFEQFSLDRRVAGIGSLFHRSLKPYYLGEEQLMTLMSKDGFYLYDGSSNPRRVSDDLMGTFRNLVQPNVVLGQRIFTTKAQWETGTVTPAASLDTTTIPGDIQLGEAPILSLVPTYTNSGYFPRNASGQSSHFLKLENNQLGPPLTIRTLGLNPVTSFGWDVLFNVTPRFVDTINFIYSLFLTGGAAGWNVDFLNVTAIDVNGNQIPVLRLSGSAATLNDGGLPVSVGGVLTTKTVFFPKTKIASFRISAQTTKVGAAAADFFLWSISSITTSVTQYKKTGLWESPIVDTALATAKSWGDYLADFDLNDQNLQFFVRSDAADPTTQDYIEVFPPQLPPYPPTDRYFQIAIEFNLASMGLDLVTQGGAPRIYDANATQKTADDTTVPFPFTKVKDSGFVGSADSGYGISQDATIHVMHWSTLASGLVNLMFFRPESLFSNATGWAVETKFKINTLISMDTWSMAVSDGVHFIGVRFTSSTIRLFKVSGGSPSDVKVYNIKLQKGVYYTIRLNGKLNVFDVYLDNDPNPIISETVLPPAAMTKKVYFGVTPTNDTPSPNTGSGTCDINVIYVAWNTNGIVVPTIVDDTTTPVAHETSQSWLSSPGGIVPTTTVAAVNWKNRFWCAATESRSAPGASVEAFNNVGMIYDTKGNWVTKRGETTGGAFYTPFFVGSFVIFQERLYWIESNSVQVVVLIPRPSATDLGAANLPTDRDISIWRGKKDDFGIKNQKEYESIQIRYKCVASLTVIAYVDDLKITTFTLPPSTGADDCILNFLSDGRQIGTYLQLEVKNGSANNLHLFELYSIVINAHRMEYEQAPLQAVAQ